MMRRFSPAILVALAGCTMFESPPAVAQKLAERPKVRTLVEGSKVQKDPETGLPIWMKAPEWYQGPMGHEADKATSDEPQILVDSTFCSIVSYQAFQDELKYLPTLSSKEGYSVINAVEFGRLRKLIASLDGVSTMTAPRISLLDGQDAWASVGASNSFSDFSAAFGLFVKPELRQDGRVRVRFSAQSSMEPEHHRFETNGDVVLAPGQWYVQVLTESTESDLAAVFFLNVPMIHYPARADSGAG